MNRQNVFFLLLTMSLLFNVFFAAGLWKGKGASEQGGVVDEVARVLDLNDEQRAYYAQLRQDLVADEASLHEQLALVRQSLLGELQKSEPDKELIASTLQQAEDIRRQQRDVEESQFREFVDLLTHEQRRLLADQARRQEPDRQRHHRERMLQRFDENGDGELSAEERQAAESHFNERQSEMRNRRDEMLRQLFAEVDVDQDEKLSLDECVELLKRFDRMIRRNGMERGDRPGGPERGRRGGPDQRGPGRDGERRGPIDPSQSVPPPRGERPPVS